MGFRPFHGAPFQVAYLKTLTPTHKGEVSLTRLSFQWLFSGPCHNAQEVIDKCHSFNETPEVSLDWPKHLIRHGITLLLLLLPVHGQR